MSLKRFRNFVIDHFPHGIKWFFRFVVHILYFCEVLTKSVLSFCLLFPLHSPVLLPNPCHLYKSFSFNYPEHTFPPPAAALLPSFPCAVQKNPREMLDFLHSAGIFPLPSDLYFVLLPQILFAL